MVLTILLVCVVAGVIARLIVYRRIPGGGIIKTVNIGVYSDEGCTANLTSIDWGLLNPGENFTREMWVKNTGNVAVMLNMTTEDWDPEAAKDYITLSWNQEGQILNVTETCKAVLTLSVSANITEAGITAFFFTIVVTGTEYTP